MPANPEKDKPRTNYARLIPKLEAPAAAAVGSAAIIFVLVAFFVVLFF